MGSFQESGNQMREVTFETEVFRTPADIKRGEVALQAYLDALYAINCQYLKDYPSTPGIYQAGVRYQREPLGFEKWKTIPIVRRDGHGDCEDLAAWRAAELTVKHGIPARPKWVLQPTGGTGIRLYHIIVQFPNGTTDDPSKRLGMKGRA